MRASRWEYFVPTWGEFWVWLATVIAPIFIFAEVLKWDRTRKEKLYRTGAIPYADRKVKMHMHYVHAE